MRKIEALEVRKQIELNIRSRRIYVFGFNNQAIEFVNRYRDEFDIAAFVSEGAYREEEEKKKVCGLDLDVINWENAIKNQNAYFIFFAVPLRYESMLSSEGLRWGYDFCSVECFELFTTKKEVMLIAGHCQVDVLSGFMTQVSELANKYCIFVLATNRQASRWSTKIIDFVRNICDVYVYLYTDPGSRDSNRLILNYNEQHRFFTKDELPKDCKIYKIPNLTSIRLYWPTMVPETMNPFYEYFRGAQHWLNRRHSPIYFTDKYLRDSLEKGISVADIVSNIDSLNMLDKCEIQNHMKRMVDLLTHIDDGCDMKIGDFILENYKKYMLFKDADHLQPVLAKEYLKRILNMIGISGDFVNKELDSAFQLGNITYDELDNHCSEVPVYRCVAEEMQLEWWKNGKKYKTLLYSGTQELTVDEYAMKYCEISLAMKHLQSIW